VRFGQASYPITGTGDAPDQKQGGRIEVDEN